MCRARLRAATAYKVPGTRSAIGRRLAANVLLAGGQVAPALAHIQKALAETKGLPDEQNNLVMAARLYAVSGRAKEADDALAALAALADPLTVTLNERLLAFARGQVALARGDFGAAIAELQKAQAALPPRASNPIAPSLHIPIWFSLGEAYVGAGKSSEAEPWFQKVATSGFEHASQPLEFVRTFYYLGKIREQAGDMTKAREAYRRFVGYWKDGDLDRERIADAEKKLRGQT